MGRSIVAVVAGFLAVVGLSLATDQLFHVLEVYPPWGQPMNDTGDNLLALSYRVVYTVLGGFITARLAPRAPMRHVMILGIIGSSPVHGRCDWRDRHRRPWPQLVSDRDCGHGLSLHLAGRHGGFTRPASVMPRAARGCRPS